MKKIEVFYHFYIPPDIRACHWSWWVDTQLSAIKKSKLASVATVNMVITMPSKWNIFTGFWYTKNGTGYAEYEVPDDHRLTFEGKVREYINARYPFVNILEVRATDEELNLYEGNTLSLLHEKCRTGDFHVLYLNNKGISGTTSSPATLNWLEVLNYFFIDQWILCVSKLDDYDMVGMKDKCTHAGVMSGNFWWTTSKYIRSLPEPLNSDAYMDDRWLDTSPGEKGYRWSFEHWPVSQHPKVYYIADTKTDHYTEYFFLEDFLKNNQNT